MRQLKAFIAIAFIASVCYGSYVIPNGGVTTAKIANGAVTTSKIGSAQIVPSILGTITDGSTLDQSGASSTLEVAPLGIGTNQIAANAVTRPKLVAVGQQISSGSGGSQTGSSSEADVTGMSVTLTTTGRPVMVMVISDGSNNPSYITAIAPSNNPSVAFYIDRDGSNVAYYPIISVISGSTAIELDIPCSIVNYLDVVSAGSHTYKLRASATAGATWGVHYAKLAAYEL